MAVLDPVRETVVIRIVYDGPAYAGKTTSVRALAKGFGVRSSTPAEVGGRTLYFDWMEYTGGMFEGRQIRCQVISVPGQAVLASRRRHLLQSADVVVFVGDSSAQAQSTTISYLKGLSAVLGQTQGPPIGIIFQANKRDHADAIPIEKLKEALDTLQLRVAVIESIATQGLGIREGFVFAVRLALDRVRELIHKRALPTMRPAVDSAEDLMNELRQVEGESLAMVAQSGLQQTPLSELAPEVADSTASAALQEAVRDNTLGPPAQVAAKSGVNPDDSDAPPRLPGSSLPSGMIWPPVDGRLILHDVASRPFELQRDDNGDWTSESDRMWKIHSFKHARFDTMDQGREVLIKWARIHTECLHLISDHRCIVLADDGHGRFRLWQILRASPSLRDEFLGSLPIGPYAIASLLLSLPRQMMQASERWSGAASGLPLKLENVGSATTGGRFVGRMPDPTCPPTAQRSSSADILQQLISEIGAIADEIRVQRHDVLKVVQAMSRGAGAPSQEDVAWAQSLLERL